MKSEGYFKIKKEYKIDINKGTFFFFVYLVLTKKHISTFLFGSIFFVM